MIYNLNVIKRRRSSIIYSITQWMKLRWHSVEWAIKGKKKKEEEAGCSCKN